MKKTIVAILLLTSTQLFAKGVLCKLTDSTGKEVTQVGGFMQNLKSTFLHFGRIDGYDITVTGMTHPKTPKQIFIVAEIHEFNKDGIRTSVSTAENKLNLTWGRSIKVANPAKAQAESTAVDSVNTASQVEGEETTENDDQEVQEFKLKLECTAS